MNTKNLNGKTRGRIIVDTSFLMNMSPLFPIEHKKEGSDFPEQYIDLLKKIAEYGYEIVIPEIVSIEACSITHDGGSTSGLIGNSHKKFASSERLLSSFFMDVVNGKYENISILHGTGNKRVDDYCDGINNANEIYLSESTDHARRSKFHTSRTHAVQIARNHTIKELKSLHSQDRHDLGDDGIVALLQNKYANSDLQTFVLSDDTGLNARIRELAHNAEPITCGKFLYSIAESGIKNHIGIAAKDSDGKIVDGAALENARRLAYSIVYQHDKMLLDIMPSDDEYYKNSTKTNIFCKSLTTTTHALNKEQKDSRKTQEEIERKPESPATDFLKTIINDQKAQEEFIGNYAGARKRRRTEAYHYKKNGKNANNEENSMWR